MSIKTNQFCQLGQVNKSACLQTLLFLMLLLVGEGMYRGNPFLGC